MAVKPYSTNFWGFFFFRVRARVQQTHTQVGREREREQKMGRNKVRAEFSAGCNFNSTRVWRHRGHQIRE
jgi:hypothetical protein